MKLFVKDITTGRIHQVGTDRHDSLMIVDGGLYYYNLQNGEGTYGGGYQFCNETGNTDFYNEEYDYYYNIGISEEKKQYKQDIKNLISEIEKLKIDKYPDLIKNQDYHIGYRDGVNCNIVDVKFILNKYIKEVVYDNNDNTR